MHLNSTGLCNWSANQISLNLTLGYFYSQQNNIRRLQCGSTFLQVVQVTVLAFFSQISLLKTGLLKKSLVQFTYIDRHSGRMAAPLPWSVKAADFGVGRAQDRQHWRHLAKRCCGSGPRKCHHPGQNLGFLMKHRRQCYYRIILFENTTLQLVINSTRRIN